MNENIRQSDETYYDTLIDNGNYANKNNINEEEQLAAVLMQSEEEYETEMILQQLAEIDRNTRTMEVDKKKRTELFELVLRRLPYSGINMVMIEEIKKAICLYKDLITESILLSKETCNKFKIYLKEIMPKLGEDAYSNIVCLL